MQYGDNTVVYAPTSADDPTKFEQDAAYKVELPTDEGVTNHPHQAYEYNDEVFIPDLGADTIWRLCGRPGYRSLFGDAEGDGQDAFDLYLLYYLPFVETATPRVSIP